jgi:hypothetical protein
LSAIYKKKFRNNLIFQKLDFLNSTENPLKSQGSLKKVKNISGTFSARAYSFSKKTRIKISLHSSFNLFIFISPLSKLTGSGERGDVSSEISQKEIKTTN